MIDEHLNRRTSDTSIGRESRLRRAATPSCEALDNDVGAPLDAPRVASLPFGEVNIGAACQVRPVCCSTTAFAGAFSA